MDCTFSCHTELLSTPLIGTSLVDNMCGTGVLSPRQRHYVVLLHLLLAS